MQTRICQIDSQHSDAGLVAEAADVLRRGGLVAFPTETVYGLGANALADEAVRRIFEAKGRPVQNPVIVHVGDVEAAKQVVADWERWPGSPRPGLRLLAGSEPDKASNDGSEMGLHREAPGGMIDFPRAASRLSPLDAPSLKSNGIDSVLRLLRILRRC